MSYDDLNFPAIAALKADNDFRDHLYVTDVPPARYLSKATQSLLKARDDAWSAYVDFEGDHAELLSDSWEKTFAKKDEAAARKAVAEGRDPMTISSALDDARSRRPKVWGALKALADRVRQTDAELVRAVRRELADIQERIEADVQAAAQEYIERQNQADAARMKYGAALRGRAWATDWALLGLRTNYSSVSEATPVDASGQEIRDDFGRPLRGAAEVKAVDASYGRVHPRPKAKIRSRANGVVLTIDASHAKTLVNRGDADYVTDAD